MTTLGEIDHDGRIEQTVRAVLFRHVSKSRERPLRDLESVYLDKAAEAQTGILIMDALMKRFGPLSAEQTDAYAQATAIRDACLAALKIENCPYRESMN